MGCKHNWVRSGHKNDLICIKCGYAAMQAQATSNIAAAAMQPLLREEISIPLYTGTNTLLVSVYKDELEKMINKSIGLNIMQGRVR